jgi:hypothetical protein
MIATDGATVSVLHTRIDLVAKAEAKKANLAAGRARSAIERHGMSESQLDDRRKKKDEEKMDAADAQNRVKQLRKRKVSRKDSACMSVRLQFVLASALGFFFFAEAQMHHE